MQIGTTITRIRLYFIMASENAATRHAALIKILPKLSGMDLHNATTWIAEYEAEQDRANAHHAAGMIRTACETLENNPDALTQLLREGLQNVTGQTWMRG